MKIILSGYMGSGKTAVGKVLAEKMRIPFLDLDAEIEKREGQDLPAIFRESGEIHFRKLEHQVLKEFLDSEEEFVLSLGGGTPCYGNNLDLLKEDPETKLFYLKNSLNTLTQRLFKEQENRPVIQHLKSKEELEDFIRKHLFERSFYYNQSDHILNADAKKPAELADEITKTLY